MMLDWGTDTEYIGLGFVRTEAIVAAAAPAIADAEVCITLSYVSALAITLTPVTQLDITLVLPEC